MSTSSDQELAPEQLLEDFGKYLERFRSRQGPLSNLKQLLGSPLDIGAVHPITAHEEVEIRLELAGKLQLLQRIDNPSWQFTAAQFAAFLLIPTAELEPTLSEGGHKDLVRSLDTIVFAMRWFLKPDLIPSYQLTRDDDLDTNLIHDESDDADDAHDSDDSDSSIDWRPAFTPKHSIESIEPDHPKRPKTASRYPGRQFKDSCHTDDNAWVTNYFKEKSKSQREKYPAENGSFCLITGARTPHISHILPSSWTQTPHNVNAAASIIPEAARMLCSSWPSCSTLGELDVVGNMIPLCPLVDWNRGKAYFGLQGTGVMPNISIDQMRNDDPIQIELQFMWLPRRSLAVDARSNGTQRDICLDFVDLDLERELYNMARAPSPAAGFNSPSNIDTDSILVSATKITTEIPLRQRMFDVRTATQVFPGQVIKADIPARKVFMFLQMLELSWALACVASISGAAEVVENGWAEW